MKLVIYSIILNHHQAPVADELFRLLYTEFCFVELGDCCDNKGGTDDYSTRPYLIRAWNTSENYKKAMLLACTADCCVFSGVQSLPFLKERMKLGLLSFDMGERWLKRGWKNLFSPTIMKMFCSYWLGGWGKKPLYRLCMSGFAALDHYKLGMYVGKCYKWGYFTKINNSEVKHNINDPNGIKFMWCARFLKLKHPELPILMAYRLKSYGYVFHLDMYGEGEYKFAAEKLVYKLGLHNEVSFLGNVTNDELMEAMRLHDIFLFTSDKNEGWGAVVNESMSNGCSIIAGDAIGSTPYLIHNGITGLFFRSPKIDSTFGDVDILALNSLVEKAVWLLRNPKEIERIGKEARVLLETIWSPANAASSLLTLIDDLKNGRVTSVIEGPCSIA